MIFSITHELIYTYDSPVRLSTQYLRLMPRDTARQKVRDWKVETPVPALRTSDGYGNLLHVLTIDKPTSEISILASGKVETAEGVDEPSDFTGTPLPPLVFLRSTALTRVDARLAALAARHAAAGDDGWPQALRELAAALREPQAQGAPSAADLVHAFIACCRHLGVPARYVSGYVHQHQSGRRRTETMTMHAWAEAWAGGRWYSFDIAAGHPIGESHVKIAIGTDYLDACPIRGVRVGGGAETLVAEAQVIATQR